jgi:hypothetical protein
MSHMLYLYDLINLVTSLTKRTCLTSLTRLTFLTCSTNIVCTHLTILSCKSKMVWIRLTHLTCLTCLTFLIHLIYLPGRRLLLQDCRRFGRRRHPRRSPRCHHHLPGSRNPPYGQEERYCQVCVKVMVRLG